ncbi:META domain-containing protein [Porphyromonadaceae bacterium W3.11]|nr:META domain-containing protein [Porphyromonadaceae bacterium W3.11]
MKRIWITISIILSVFMLSSCSSKSQVMKLKGEWSIIEANGQQIQLENAFIGINPESKTIYGNSGCNNIFASIDTDDHPNEIEIEDLASTLSLCEHSDVEMSIQNALNKVEKFELSKDGKELKMYDEDKAVVLVLQKRSDDLKDISSNQDTNDLNTPSLSDQTIIKPSELDGEWSVLQVGDLIIKEQKLQKEPVIGFDIDKLSIGGNLSCNSFSSSISFSDEDSEDYDPTWIDIEAIMTTRMACENMDVEQALAKALSDADHFYMNEDGTVSFYAGGEEVVVLTRK